MDKLPVDNVRAEKLRLGVDEVTILADCSQTGGALLAVEILMPPGGGPPVMHRHVPGEVYHVLRGEFTFYTSEAAEEAGSEGASRTATHAASETGSRSSKTKRWTARAGDVVPLAGGVPHSVRNESGEDAVAFVVHAPGAPMEGFVRAVAAMTGEPDMDVVLAIAADHGIELLGPI